MSEDKGGCNSSEGSKPEATSTPSLPGKCGCNYPSLGNVFLPKRKRRMVTLRKQPLPYGLSKSVVMLMGCISICLTSSLYYNWTIFEVLLMKEGVLAGLCSDEDRAVAKPGTFVCDAQRRGISNLYAVILYSDCFISSLGGYIGDRYGAFYALIIGQISGVIAFVMFHIFCQSTRMLYVTFFFWAISCSLALAPTWHYSRMFTFGNNMAVSIITAADNLSMFTPTLFQIIARRYNMGFSGVSLTYIFWAILTSLAITLFFIPKRFVVIDSEEEDDSQDISQMFNKSLLNALKDPRFGLSVICYVLLCSVRLFYRRSFTLLFFDNEEVIEFMEAISDLSFLGSFILGYLNEYLGVVAMMSITTLMYIFALGAVYFRNFTCAYTSALLFAIAQVGDIQQLITFIDEVFPEHESTLMGISNIVNSVFGMLLQIVFNKIFDILGPHITVALMMIILVGVMAICYIITFAFQSEGGTGSSVNTKIVKGIQCDGNCAHSTDMEQMEYNPRGNDMLMTNILSVFLNLPYSLCMAIEAAINNRGQHSPQTRPQCFEDRVVRLIECEQFCSSSNRLVELCSAVFSTSLVLLIGCMYEFSKNSKLMQGYNTFSTLMVCLCLSAGLTSLVLPFTKIYKVIPPVMAVGLNSLPPLAMLIFFCRNHGEAVSFTIMCGLVITYGAFIFTMGNTTLYLNSMMGARYGKKIHSLLGWSSMGMGYLYALLAVFAAKALYKGNSIIGGYVLIMPMQCVVCLFAILILCLYLSHERQYFNLKKNSNVGNGNNGGSGTKHEDGFSVEGENCGPEESDLYFRSKYSTTWNSTALSPDYGIFWLNYKDESKIKFSLTFLLLSFSTAITMIDVVLVFLMPNFIFQAIITAIVYFIVRMVFMFVNPELMDCLLTLTAPTDIYFKVLCMCLSVITLAINLSHFRWLLSDDIYPYYLIFCICFGIRLFFNSMLHHHILSCIERFKDKPNSSDKYSYGQTTVFYMNVGYLLGLMCAIVLCYLYGRL